MNANEALWIYARGCDVALSASGSGDGLPVIARTGIRQD